VTGRLVERIADAVLYEGYMLYPYRPSAVKNRQRFNFGVLYPDAYAAGALAGPTDRGFLKIECLVDAYHGATLSVTARFLHLVERISVRGDLAEPWQEAMEREVRMEPRRVSSLPGATARTPFSFSTTEQVEPLVAGGETVGAVTRRQRRIHGEIEVTARLCVGGVHRVTVQLLNRTTVADVPDPSRDELLLRSLVSAHLILTVSDGEFISLLDPPQRFAELAAGCENVGAWPVLAGEDGARDTMLASPIILYDYPEIAPESAGDLFDGTEIDEILSLRILTLTDEEKREMWQSDERARLILQRTESLAAEQMMRLHGTLRLPGALPEEIS
jgi:hypothetical protein